MKWPYSVFIELTNKCNSHCLHCRENSGKNLQDELSTEEIKTILSDCSINGTKFIIFTGGEPLLRADVFEILEYSSQIGLRTLLATNGTLLDDKKADFLSKLKNVFVQISIDGLSSVHDKFRGSKDAFVNAINGITLCKRYGVGVSISFTCTKLNIKEIPKIISLAEKLNVKTLKLRRFIASGRGLDNINTLDLTPDEVKNTVEKYQRLKTESRNKVKINMEQAPFQVLCDGTILGHDKNIHGGCSTGIALCVIGPTGIVRPCPSLGIDIGNIRESNLQTIWESSEILANLRNRKNLYGRCGICDYRSSCGGCRAAAYAQAGDCLAEDPMCWHDPPALVVEYKNVARIKMPRITVGVMQNLIV